MTTLNSTGLAVAIAPHDCPPVDEKDGFVLFAGEEGKDPRQIEAEYLQKVLSLRALGGFSLWVNPSGYVGKSAAYEYGIAQACGVPAFFTEMPDDVPFYIDPSSVRSAEDLAEYMLSNEGRLPDVRAGDDPIAQTWDRLAFPVASVAVGGIMHFRKKILLVEDGRWPNGQLTVPGTTVRARETREESLHRLFGKKLDVSVHAVSPFRTSFMIDGSGYEKPVSSVVFDDRRVELSSERVQPQIGITHHWASPAQIESLVVAGGVEPNAAASLTDYLATV